MSGWHGLGDEREIFRPFLDLGNARGACTWVAKRSFAGDVGGVYGPRWLGAKGCSRGTIRTPAKTEMRPDALSDRIA